VDSKAGKFSSFFRKKCLTIGLGRVIIISSPQTTTKQTRGMTKMNGKRSVKKNSANYPVKKSIRILKDKINKLSLKESK
jgi:hypothetical protein